MSAQTTLAGLTGTAPDFVLLILGANAGLIGMSKVSLTSVLRHVEEIVSVRLLILVVDAACRNTSRSR